MLLILIPFLNFLFRFVNEKAATLVISLLVGHTAWHWLAERYGRLAKFPFPALDAASITADRRPVAVRSRSVRSRAAAIERHERIAVRIRRPAVAAAFQVLEIDERTTRDANARERDGKHDERT